jgi:NAD-dependent dihydropyrimidine dehydrogenase PreA subunit
MSVEIDQEKCTGCGICADICPMEAIKVNNVAEIDASACADCGSCIEVCPNEAIISSD